MLFAGLQGEHESTLSATVLCHAHNASRHLADEFLGAAHIADARTAERHRDAQALTFAHRNVGTPFAGRLQHGKVGSHTVDDEESLLLVDGVGHSCEVLDNTIVVGCLYHHACHTALSEFLLQIIAVGHAILLGNAHDVDAMEMSIGIDHPARLRVKGFAHQHLCGFLGGTECHHHGFGRGGGTVVERSIRDVHASQFGHHALVFKNVVERALRDFRLIRSIAGQELRPLDKVLYNGWRIVVVASCTGKHRQRCIQLGQGMKIFAELYFALCLGQVVIAFEADSLGHVGIEFIQRTHPRLFKHLL